MLASLLGELGFEEAADAQTVNWVMSHPEIEIFVAVDPQDRAVAMAAFSHRPQLRLRGRVATVEEMIVSEPYRRKGVGRALLQRLVERTRSLSVKRVELHSHLAAGDPGARPFFQACGFECVAGEVFSLTPAA